MAEKMKLGEWLGECIEGNSGAKATKILSHYYKTDSLVETAKSVDATVRTAQLEGRKLNAMESLTMELLFDLAGWESPKEAIENYQSYLAE